MRIYLLRHATAEEPGAGPDSARQLTVQGRREAREAGVALRDRKETIAVVLSSPRIRARETAEQIAGVLGGGLRVEIRERLSCGATSADYWEEIRKQTDGAILLVAHNPELSAFVSSLAGQIVSFKPSTLCCLEVEDAGARLVWIRHPNP